MVRIQYGSPRSPYGHDTTYRYLKPNGRWTGWRLQANAPHREPPTVLKALFGGRP